MKGRVPESQLAQVAVVPTPNEASNRYACVPHGVEHLQSCERSRHAAVSSGGCELPVAPDHKTESPSEQGHSVSGTSAPHARAHQRVPL